MAVRAITVMALMASATRCFATDYYLGSDASTQTGVAVETIAALNALDLEPGDRVFFAAGESFSGSIELGPDDAGTAANPITISSYGSGRASISSGNQPGIRILNAGGFAISRLNLIGSASNRSSGIDAGAWLSTNTQLVHLRLDQLKVSGYRIGIEIWGWPQDGSWVWPGWRDVVLTDLEVTDNRGDGINVWGHWKANTSSPTYSHRDFTIRGSLVANNRGDASATSHTGSGIVLGCVENAVIESCVAHDNGGVGPTTGGGPFGIWVWESRRVTIQRNLVYNQRSPSVDGGAFDLDGGSVDCVVQHNYSYNNQGPAFALIQFPGATAVRNNVIRYNISQNDARKAFAHGAIYVGDWGDGSGVHNAEIYGNTIYLAATSDGRRPPAVMVEDHVRINGVRLRNNLFHLAHNGPVLAGMRSRPAAALYQGNNYWGGNFDFAAFRQSGQETLDGQPIGLRIDPNLQNPGQGGSVAAIADLSQLNAYRLRNGSPLRGAGLDLRKRFGLDPGAADFFGQPVTTAVPAIGADAYPAAGSDTQPPSSPGNLIAQAVTAQSVELRWSPSHDNVRVSEYLVFRNGAVVATTAAPSHQSTGLQPDTLYQFDVVAEDAAGNASAPASIAVRTSAAAPNSAAIRINAGGRAYTDRAGRTWAADANYNTGSTAKTTAGIAGTLDDGLYQTERWDPATGSELQYAVSVPNGAYDIALHFAETHGPCMAVGARRFDVLIEGSTIWNNLDIFAEAGANARLVKTTRATVADGQLTIRFQRRVQNPKICAIEIMPATTAAVFRANAGGGSYVDPTGGTWSADHGFSGGSTYTSSASIGGTNADSLFRTQRYVPAGVSSLAYRWTIPNGTYRVRLLFAETYPGAMKVGGRTFDVWVEGLLRFDNLDVYAEAGANAALIKETMVTISDGTLDLALTRGVQNPFLCGIEVLSP